jgi:predicted short-subunit dehydrogenase-like oxidoreductase (DUF2520 family)
LRVGVGAAKRPAKVPEFDLLLVAVPDRKINAVARSWADRVSWEGRSALHTSGVIGTSALEPLKRQGAEVGCLHPLLSLPWADLARGAFKGVYFGIQGEAPVIRLARRLARDAGGKVLEVRGEDKALYHLAACLSSGYLLGLIDAAASSVASGVAPTARFREALLALAASAIRNARKAGLPASLTGPIPRGDIATIEAHLASLARLPSAWENLHGVLARHTLDLAVRSRRISPAVAARIRRLLAGKR